MQILICSGSPLKRLRTRDAALAMGFDSIVLISPKAFAEFKRSKKLPRSLELNILETPTEGH